jgi:hypothetical protein
LPVKVKRKPAVEPAGAHRRPTRERVEAQGRRRKRCSIRAESGIISTTFSEQLRSKEESHARKRRPDPVALEGRL